MAINKKLFSDKIIRSETVKNIIQITEQSLPPSEPAILPNDSKSESFLSDSFVPGSRQQITLSPENPKPLIICSSEYLNLFDTNNELTITGKTLLQKEASKLLNSKVVATYISQSNSISDVFKSNEIELNSFIDKKTKNDSQIFFNKMSGKSLLNLKSFSSNSNTSSLLSFNDILNQNGHGNLSVQYTNTKIWNQSLVHFKRLIFLHSETFCQQNLPQISFNSSDIEIDDKGNTKYILNYFKYSNDPLQIKTIERINYSLNVLDKFSKNIFIDFKNRATLNLEVTNYSNENKINNLHLYFHNIFREILVSCSIKSLGTADKKFLLDRGFDIDQFFGKEKFNIWDIPIGTTIKDSLSVPDDVGSALTDLSRENYGTGNNRIKILTFENQTTDSKSLGIIPGSKFYIDESFYINRSDQKNISVLYDKSLNANQSFSILKKIAGLSDGVNSFNPNFEPFKNSSIFRTLPKITNTTSLYQNLLNFQGTSVSFNLEKLKLLNLNQSKSQQFGIRVPSLILKSSLTGKYKNTPLRHLIFLYLINNAYYKKSFYKNDSSYSYEENTRHLKDLLNNQIEDIVLETNYTDRINKFLSGNCVPYRISEPDGSFIAGEEGVLNLRNKGKELSKQDLFNIEDELSIWNIISEIFVSILDLPMWDNNINDVSRGATTYSGVDKMLFCYICFEAISYSISLQTPEDLNGVFRYAYRKDDVSNMSLINLLDITTNNSQLLNYYTVNGNKIFPIALSGYISKFLSETKKINDHFVFYQDFLSRISQYVTQLMNLFNSDSYSNTKQDSVNLYDQIGVSSSTNRNKLYNLSLVDSQLNLQKYHENELKEKLSLRSSENLESFSSKMTTYLNFQKEICRYLPINELDLVSTNLIIDNFKNMLPGYNSRIFSIGFEPGLIDNFSTIKKTILKVKIYRINNKIPEIIYIPKEFWFDTARFVKKSIFNDFSRWETVSTKIISSAGIIENQCYDEKRSFPLEVGLIDYSSFSHDAKRESYKNCVESFFLEEYLRWFTGIRFCESTFENFDGITPDSTPDQIPPGNSIELSSSLFEYFSKNETFGSNIRDLKKKIIHPKKFDRIFNVLISPEDFEIDKNRTIQTIRADVFENLKNQNQIYEIDGKWRDKPFLSKNFKDVCFDEYFVTVDS